MSLGVWGLTRSSKRLPVDFLVSFLILKFHKIKVPEWGDQ